MTHKASRRRTPVPPSPGAAGTVAPPPSGRRLDASGWALAAVLLAALIVLLVHSGIFAFLTDDAYISFRYARNLSHGYGLVFNPGFERVEGYSNLLWVLVLAAVDRMGVAPERAANPLSLACTVGLWAVLAVWGWKRRGTPAAWCLGLPVLWLAVTRSFAVWTTSGLETRCFELWVIAGALRLVDEVEAALEQRAARPVAAVLFALAVLTRPDGMLLALSAFAAGSLVLARRRRGALRGYLAGWASFAIVAGAQLAFRHIYYGEWVPNTYFAKVDGHTDVRLGLEYLAAFCLEYAAWTWLPLVVYGAFRLWRAGTPTLPLVAAAALLPYTAYVVAIGGDHFEYRPLDLLFPLAFVVAAEGVRGIAMRRAGRTTALAICVVVGAGLVVRPWQTHAQFPPEYHPGFPGHPGYEAGVARDFLAPAHDGIYRLPGLSRLAAEHRRLLFTLTRRFACIRQEEHRLFLGTSLAEGERIRELIANGRLPHDVYIAMSCVGAMPYVSGVRTLDRHGLTDAHVARSRFEKDPLLAHGKFATLDYARSRGVDLWTVDKAYLMGEVTSEAVLQSIRYAGRDHEDDYAADLGGGWLLMAQLPLGLESARRRMPRLEFLRLDDTTFIRRFADASLPRYLDWMQAHPGDLAAAVRLAYIARIAGRWDLATRAYEALAAVLPPTADLFEQLADCYEGSGAYDRAARTIDRAIEAATRTGDTERAGRLAARRDDDRARAAGR